MKRGQLQRQRQSNCNDCRGRSVIAYKYQYKCPGVIEVSDLQVVDASKVAIDDSWERRSHRYQWYRCVSPLSSCENSVLARRQEDRAERERVEKGEK